MSEMFFLEDSIIEREMMIRVSVFFIRGWFGEIVKRVGFFLSVFLFFFRYYISSVKVDIF